LKRDVLGYLRCFEAASRLLNFTQAADELSITQSAVSHQIKELSIRCGFALFKRQGNTLELTDKGRLYANSVRESLVSLEDGLTALQSDVGESAITIHSDPVLANKWLLPRLDQLEAQCLPSCINLVSVGEASDADLTIGFDAPRGHDTAQIDLDVCLPVCSPDILVIGADDLAPSDMLSETMIALGDPTLERRFGMSWAIWEENFGKDSTPQAGIEKHATIELVLQAAVHGRGVALLRKSIADDDLRAQRLVVACQGNLRSPVPILISLNPKSPRAELSARLRDWLLREMDITLSN